MKLYIAADDHEHAILVADEDSNDIAEFFHRDHATVGQSYDTALMLARTLVAAATEDAHGVTESDRLFAEQILADFGSFEEGITDQEKLAQWVRNIRCAASTPDESQPSDRPGTGPLQFSKDWPGVFIRGDDALSAARVLRGAYEFAEKRAREDANWASDPELWTRLKEIEGLLESCRTSSQLPRPAPQEVSRREALS